MAQKKTPWIVLGIVMSLSLPQLWAEGREGVDWPSFRGPNGRGIAEGFSLPEKWDGTRSENIRWKTAIPGLGHASPVIWGDKIFVVTAISGKADAGLRVGLYGDIAPVEDDTVHEWKVLCLDKKSGEILWERTAHRGVPAIKRHTKATHANSTPATDGRHLVVFLGSEGLYCYDLNGELLWKKDFGVLDSGYFRVPAAQWGFASSPLLHDGVIYLQVDVQENSFVAALRVQDGEEIWRTSRDEVPTWSTPAMAQVGERPQVVVNGFKHIGGYDAKTGVETWRLTGGGDIPVPVPQVVDDLVLITNAHGGWAPIYAVKTSATGDISLAVGATSNQGVAWSYPRSGSYMPTPLIYGDYLYINRDNGVFRSFEVKTGKEVIEETRIENVAFTASGVAGDGKLYYTSEEGEVIVLRAGDRFQQLSRNPLGEVCLSSPAVSEGAIYFRTKGHVVAVAE